MRRTAESTEPRVTASRSDSCTARAAACFRRSVCEFRTSVQTAEAHHTLVLDPDGLAVPHLDGLHGALLRAQPAADAAALDAELRGEPRAVVVNRLGYQLGDERRSARKHGPACAALAHAAYRTVDTCFRRAGESRRLFARREVENRRPCVCHAHRVVRVDFPPAYGALAAMTPAARGSSRRWR